MGTHPIFESDFDCLTDMDKWAVEVEQYERVLRSFSLGKLTESVESYVRANKWVLKARVPKRFCLHHNKYEAKCVCKPMSNRYTRPGRSLVYVALRENYSLKFDHDKDWVELVAFLKEQEADFHCSEEPHSGHGMKTTPFQFFFNAILIPSVKSRHHYVKQSKSVRKSLDDILSMINPDNDVYFNGKIARMINKPVSIDVAMLKKDTSDNGVANNQHNSEAVTIVESSEEGDDFFIGNNSDITADQKSENDVCLNKQATVETQTDPIVESAESAVNKSKSPLDEIKPFLKPGENSQEMLPSEVFMMVKKRIFSTRYKRTKLDTGDIYDEWDRVRQDDKYREAYVKATEIYNKSVRKRKRKLPDKNNQSTSDPLSQQ